MKNLLIVQGGIASACAVQAGIPEFSGQPSPAKFHRKLDGRPHLILIAKWNGQLAGYKVGYAQNQTCFYSWMGGVLPPFRRLGIALQLMNHQEQWVLNKGYHFIHGKTKREFSGMFALLCKRGYEVVPGPLPASGKIEMVKDLTQSTSIIA